MNFSEGRAEPRGQEMAREPVVQWPLLALSHLRLRPTHWRVANMVLEDTAAVISMNTPVPFR
jgi:hypothetical protein